MPLPRESTPWPIPAYGPAADRYRFDEALWLNDTDALAAILTGGTTATAPGTADRTRRGILHRGGIINFGRRWFTAQQKPISTGEVRTDLPVPIAANLARLSAAQLMAEAPTSRLILTRDRPAIDGDGQPVLRNGVPAVAKRGSIDKGPGQDRLDLIANSDDARMTLLEGAELASALSGAVLKAQWDTTDPDRQAVWFDVVGADCALPEWTPTGRLAAMTLWQTYPGPRANTIFRHLERHESGTITHALYLGTDVSIGKLRPLGEVEALAGIPNLPNVVADASGVVIIPTGVTRLTAAYWRNRPGKVWRHSGALANLGRSDFLGIEPLLDAYSEAWSALMRDIRLGKARAFVPPGTLQMLGGQDGAAAWFDTEREIYRELAMEVDGSVRQGVIVDQPTIRWQEHLKTLAGLKLELLDGAGWSLASYGQSAADDSTGAVTATEVNDRVSKSEQTRDEKALQFKQAGTPFFKMLLELDGIHYPGQGGGAYPELRIDFPEVSQVDAAKQAATFLSLREAYAISIEQTVRERRPNWDEDEVLAEVDRILADADRLRGGALADPAGIGRVDPDPADPDEGTPATDSQAEQTPEPVPAR